MKKLTAVFLSILMILAMLASCSSSDDSLENDDNKKKGKEKKEIVEDVTFDSAVEKMLSEMEKADNYGLKFTDEIEFVFDEESSAMNIEAVIEQTDSTVYIKFVSESTDEESDTIEGYLKKSNYNTSYSYENGKWYKDNERGEIDSSLVDMGKTNLLYTEHLDEGTLSEVKYNGKDCYKLTGKVFLDEYCKVDNESDVSVIMTFVEEYGLSETEYDSISPAELVLYIDKSTFLPISYTMDYKEMFNSLNEKTSDNDDFLSAQEYKLSIEYYDFGEIELEIPAEALNAKDRIPFKTILDRSKDAVENVDNYGMDATMYLDIEMLSAFFEMTLDVSAERDGDYAYSRTITKIDSLGASSTTEVYSDYNEMIEYTCTDGYWSSDYIYEEPETLAFDMAYYMEYMEEAEVDEVVFGDLDCYEVRGEVEIDFLELMENMDMEDLNRKLEEEGLDEGFYEQVFAEKVPFTLELGIDKNSYLPVYFEVDLTDMLDTYISAAMDYIAEKTGEDDVDAEVMDCRLSATYRDYGEVSVEMPAVEMTATSDEAIVAEYVAAMQEEVDSMNETLVESGIMVSVYADGTEIVYAYIMINEITAEEEAAIMNNKADAEEAAKSSFESIHWLYPEVTAIRFEYYRCDGSLIYSVKS